MSIGSHDSTTFYLDKCSPLYYACVSNIVYDWAKCQDLNFTQQLEAGIRYLDLRVSAKGCCDNELYLHHTMFSLRVQDMANAVAVFLQEHDKEVVLLDFNHVENLSEEQHEQCITILRRTFGDKMCKYPADVEPITLNYLWENKFQVVIFYHDDNARVDQDLWPGGDIPSPWPNVTDTVKLVEYLEKNYDHGREQKKFHVTQGVLTPSRCMVIKNVCSSLKDECSDKCGDNFVEWLKGKKAGNGGINICIIDFADKYDYIPTVLSLNQKLLRMRTNKSLNQTPEISLDDVKTTVQSEEITKEM